MSHTEIIHRTMQKAAKSMDHLSMKAGDISHQSPCLFDQLIQDPDLPAYRSGPGQQNADLAVESLQKRFNLAARERFFAGATGERIPDIFTRHFPDIRNQVIATAEAVCQGRFDILGYGSMDFGHPVKWNLDPVAGRQVAAIHWSRIDPLDPAMVGDSKVIWELNRHQWLVCLGQAYRLTGDEKYAQVFASSVRAWMQANPPGLGINWTSSLEVSMRLMSWCWALILFRNSKALSPGLFADMMAWTGTHASYIERYLSRYYSPNTHLTGEALGLLYAGLICPEFRGANRWRKLGRQILEEQIERQVYVDGVYFEQSTRYQSYTVEIYLHFIILAAMHNEPVAPLVTQRVRQMLDFLLMVRSPDGSMPQIGDADGGNLLPLVRRNPDDFRGLFSTAAVLFNRQDYAWAAGALAPETVWLSGAASTEIFESLAPEPPRTSPDHLYPHGGYAVMRSDWNDDAHQLVFDTGPLGCPHSSGHGHADLLSIQCSVFGQPYLVDAGTYCYTADAMWRNYFRSTFAHNSVVVDGTSQAEPAGPFSWKKKAKASLRRWIVTKDSVLVDADHAAYRGLADPVTHRRRVLFVKSGYWVVVDDLDGRKQHQLDVSWQFARLEVSMRHDGWVIAAGRNGRGLGIRAFSSAPLEANIVRGGLGPLRGWISPDYGQLICAPQLVYSLLEELPVRIVTLLLPLRSVADAPPLIDRHMHGRSMTLTFEGGRETILINDHDILVTGQES